MFLDYPWQSWLIILGIPLLLTASFVFLTRYEGGKMKEAKEYFKKTEL